MERSLNYVKRFLHCGRNDDASKPLAVLAKKKAALFRTAFKPGLRVNVIKLRDKSQKDVTLSVVEGHLFAIYPSQKVFDYAQTDDRGTYLALLNFLQAIHFFIG
ncbi:hypothetical protein BCL90_5091 [Pedobacter alluvionis]|uniref:Uncharacterized protein n=1 Tax=Pedobacter alluvionis TaxID=475253 RepID=A0A497XMY6_9SPHI|nr:hypothetical protein BCL90_5091 [Pedobacter alluvionis]